MKKRQKSPRQKESRQGFDFLEKMFRERRILRKNAEAPTSPLSEHAKRVLQDQFGISETEREGLKTTEALLRAIRGAVRRRIYDLRFRRADPKYRVHDHSDEADAERYMLRYKVEEWLQNSSLPTPPDIHTFLYHPHWLES